MSRVGTLAHVALLALTACAKGGSATSDAAIDAFRPVDAEIDGNGCLVQPCSILPQCGCGGPNACDVDTDGTGTACRNILTPGTETDTCSRTTCDRNYVCIGGASYTSCHKYCGSDVDCGSPRGRCALKLANAGPDVPNYCSSNCNPTDTTAAGCPSTFKCTLFTAPGDVKVVDCSLAGSGTQGTDCTAGTQPYESKCAKGFQCAQFVGDTAFKCRKICTNPGSTGQCGGTNTCVGYNPPHTIGTETYGVCGP